MEENRIPIKVVKVSSNDTVPLVYIPKELARILKVAKGDKLMFSFNNKTREVIIEKIEQVVMEDIPMAEREAKVETVVEGR
jgi:bifunctional DNA-binding transcriptional regulator/antitoxin component of YhaV-PrlF toxin-antitoxin module